MIRRPPRSTLFPHDALPIFGERAAHLRQEMQDERLRHRAYTREHGDDSPEVDRKSTRLNSSYPSISYAVFCLKKKKYKKQPHSTYKKKDSSYNVITVRKIII